MITDVPCLAMTLTPGIPAGSDAYLFALEGECAAVMKAARRESSNRRQEKVGRWDGQGPRFAEYSSLGLHRYSIMEPRELLGKDDDGSEIWAEERKTYVTEPYSIDDRALQELAELHKEWGITIDAGYAQHSPGFTVRINFQQQRSGEQTAITTAPDNTTEEKKRYGDDSRATGHQRESG